MASLIDLATEILIKILINLSLADTFRFKRVSSFFKELIDTSPEIGYKIGLQVSGLLENPKCDIDIAKRLIYLKRKEQCWDSCTTMSLPDLPLPKDGTAVYSVTPTAYISGTAQKKTGSSAISVPPETNGLQSLRIPTLFDFDDPKVNAKNPPGSWSIFQSVWNIINFAASIEENDLWACVASTPDTDNPGNFDIVLALLRISTSKAHSLAKRPIFRIGGYKPTEVPQVRIEVSGENVAVVLYFRNRKIKSSISIFDWKTGERKANLYFLGDLSIAFLREDILMCANAARNSLDIYHIPSSQALSFNPPPPKTPSAYTPPIYVRVVLALQLPTLLPGRHILSFLCRSSPNPTAGGKFPKYTPLSQPFVNDPVSAIILLVMDVVREGDQPDPQRFSMVVHRSALLNLVPMDKIAVTERAADVLRRREEKKKGLTAHAPQRVNEKEVKAEFTTQFRPWNEWGPPITRWFKDGFTPRSIACTAGQRCVQYTKPEPFSAGRADTIHVLDFNSWAVKRIWNWVGKSSNLFRTPESENTISVVGMGQSTVIANSRQEAKENVFPATGVFASDIVGRLPYTRCTINKKYNYDGVLLTEHAILGVRLNPTVHYKTKAISCMFVG